MPFSPLDRPDRFGGIVILFNWEGSHLIDLLKEVFTAGLFLDPVLLLNSLLDLLQVKPVPHRHRHLLGSHLRGRKYKLFCGRFGTSFGCGFAEVHLNIVQLLQLGEGAQN